MVQEEASTSGQDVCSGERIAGGQLCRRAPAFSADGKRLFVCVGAEVRMYRYEGRGCEGKGRRWPGGVSGLAVAGVRDRPPLPPPTLPSLNTPPPPPPLLSPSGSTLALISVLRGHSAEVTAVLPNPRNSLQARGREGGRPLMGGAPCLGASLSAACLLLPR